MNRAEKGIK